MLLWILQVTIGSVYQGKWQKRKEKVWILIVVKKEKKEKDNVAVLN